MIRKSLLLIIFIFIYLCGFSQPINIIFDNGYYVGNYINSNNKESIYFFLKFLSNQEDSVLIILPYKLKKSINKNTNKSNELLMIETVNKYINRISGSLQSTEYKEVLMESWTIIGFSNIVYFENVNNKLIVNVNIIDIGTNKIEIFSIEGNILNEGKEIDAIIYSDKNTFELSNINFVFIENT